MFSFRRRRPKITGTGIGLNPGDDHYRAFVGPPEDCDRVAAMAFNLLTCIGLRKTVSLDAMPKDRPFF